MYDWYIKFVIVENHFKDFAKYPLEESNTKQNIKKIQKDDSNKQENVFKTRYIRP